MNIMTIIGMILTVLVVVGFSHVGMADNQISNLVNKVNR